jgi:hypothetical protein
VSRLARKVAETSAAYKAMSPELRARFEAGLVAAKDALAVVTEEIPPPLRTLFLDVLMMGIMEGKIAGKWAKVHQAVAEGAPEIYPHVREIIPDGSNQDLPL